MKHVVIYAEAGRFAGWPANNGLWSWGGREILAGFTLGGFDEQPGHNIREPYRSILARSRNEGDTWTAVEPENFVGRAAGVSGSPGGFDFTAFGFAMRVVGTGYHGSDNPAGAFYASDDRGDTWRGPFSFGSLADHTELLGLEITSRTDYIVSGPGECLLMMSARGPEVFTDRVFCARTSDGGRSFSFVSWIVGPADPYRAVMPSTVRCRSRRLVSAIRRRDLTTGRCWIDAYGSAEDGSKWVHLASVGDTGPWNGNPPALAALTDGRLCCVYGDRQSCRMMAKFSPDEGRTWDGESVLRADFRRDRYGDPDLGYPRVVQRADGRLLAVYYWATAEIPAQHIAATIWDPNGNQETGTDDFSAT